MTLTVESREDTESVRVRAVDTIDLLCFDFNFDGNSIRGSGVAGVVWVLSGDCHNDEQEKKRVNIYSYQQVSMSFEYFREIERNTP
jgi:hypothetical protein